MEKEIQQENKTQSRVLRNRGEIKKPDKYQANLIELKEPNTGKRSLERK